MLLSNLKVLLYPFSLLYGSISWLHQKLHHNNFFSYYKFKIPIINVGNLAFGGTGKSPHVLWIYDYLNQQNKATAIVSRGYKRKNKELIWVKKNASAKEVGDEPLLFKQKRPKSTVVVCPQRSRAVKAILKEAPHIQTILLDDAFQHWAIEASLHILLTTFQRPFFEDYTAPMGYLREFRRGYRRANIIIVSKCPKDISLQQKQDYIQKIKPLSYQSIFFSFYEYQDCYVLGLPQKKLLLSELKNKEIIVLTAIANTSYLEQFIQKNTSKATYLKYSDHHYFTLQDLKKIALTAQDKIILTTEKDATKLLVFQDFLKQNNLTIYCLPIVPKIAFGEAAELQKLLDKAT